MILDIPPHIEQVLTTKAQAQGLTIAELIAQYAQPKSVSDLVKGKHLQGFNDDPVAIQRAMRDD